MHSTASGTETSSEIAPRTERTIGDLDPQLGCSCFSLSPSLSFYNPSGTCIPLQVAVYHNAPYRYFCQVSDFRLYLRLHITIGFQFKSGFEISRRNVLFSFPEDFHFLSNLFSLEISTRMYPCLIKWRNFGKQSSRQWSVKNCRIGWMYSTGSTCFLRGFRISKIVLIVEGLPDIW